MNKTTMKQVQSVKKNHNTVCDWHLHSEWILGCEGYTFNEFFTMIQFKTDIAWCKWADIQGSGIIRAILKVTLRPIDVI